MAAIGIVTGHSIVREATHVPPNSIVAGVPATVVATRNNYAANKLNAMAFYENAQAYARGYYQRWSDADYQQQMAALKTQLSAEQAALAAE